MKQDTPAGDLLSHLTMEPCSDSPTLREEVDWPSFAVAGNRIQPRWCREKEVLCGRASQNHCEESLAFPGLDSQEGAQAADVSNAGDRGADETVCAPFSETVLSELGDAYKQLGHPVKMVDSASRCLKLGPNSTFPVGSRVTWP